MEKKLFAVFCLATIPLNVLCIAIDTSIVKDSQNATKEMMKYSEEDTYEEKPDPSPLIIPGYNLPGPIFNNGKPFYVEKDPVTGAIDFNSKTPAGKQTSYLNEYDYVDEEASTNIFDKSNIDRKDSSFGSHRPNDINQLTPNFHDFLNLPVKYNPDKYVYPLISSSYANTKIQGNVNSYNHKHYSASTFKPTVSPSYYTTKASVYYKPKETYTTDKHVKYTTTTTTTTSTTTPRPTTTEPSAKPASNLLNSPMNHPSYYTTEESDYEYDYYTTKPPMKQQEFTKTEHPKIEQMPSTTKRPYSIFDELFGDYEEPKQPIKPPPLFSNLPSMNFGNKYEKPEEETKITTTTSESTTKNDTQGLNNLITHNSHGMPLSGTYNKQENEYEYDDYYSEETSENTKKNNTSQIVTPEPTKTQSTYTQSDTTTTSTTKKSNTMPPVYSNFHQNYKPVEETDTYNYYQQNKTVNDTKPTTKPTDYISITSENYDDYEEDEKITKSSTKYISITETPPAMRVTSLPLGENHPNVRLPIISMSNLSLKEQLNNERVNMTTKPVQEKTGNVVLNQKQPTMIRPAPSTSNIHIAPDQDMVSFVVGNQQHVETTKPNGQVNKETFTSNSFRPLYSNENPVQQLQSYDQMQNGGVVKETITFTGTGQTNSNYSWTVPTQNKYDAVYPNSFITMPSSNVYNQEIQSNYSWTVPEPTNVKYNPEQPTKYSPEQQIKYPEQPIKYNPEQTIKYNPEQTIKYNPEQAIKYSPSQSNSLYNPSQGDFNLQQVNAGYSVGQSNANYGQGSVFNVGISNYGDNIKYKLPQDTSAYQYAQVGTNYNMTVFPEASSSINIQPLRGAEASLTIGTPTNEVKTVPGQVVDEKLDLKNIEEYKPGNKIVFPEDDDVPTYTSPSPNREVLSLYSKPMLHQLPADLTPPNEPEIKQTIRPINVRPPWDPRPGHFYQGRPEYARPPRPQHKPEVYKRIDGLPNILPQFRPNAKVGASAHYHENIPLNPGYMQRQPLLERPSNRPIGFFEKLQPPPPPKRILDLRKPVTLNQHLQNEMKQERINLDRHTQERHTERINPEQKTQQSNQRTEPQFGPPKVPVANRRNGEDETEIATLQMLHAKQTDKLNIIKPNMPPPFKINYKEVTDKPLYVVYPVNSSPLKLDVLDSDNRETVVIGTRSEQPLPPSKINQEFPTYTEQKPILKPKDRNDAPILKPHLRPTNFPIKTDFPYPLERPDPTAHYNVPEPTPTNNGNTLDNIDIPNAYKRLTNQMLTNPDAYKSNNQWTSLDTESRIINGNKINYAEPISATLKTYTQSPIAIAYTPTEPSDGQKYSLPNYGSAVISEIRNERPGEVINGENKSHRHGIITNSGSEFTVSAVMHTHTQNNMMLGNTVRKGQDKLENHKIDTDVEPVQYPAKLDFQAPFQASVNVGSQNTGWSVVRDKSKSEIDRSDNEITTLLPESSSEFDIENFKPQMFGGFKPIYEFTEDKDKVESDTEISE